MRTRETLLAVATIVALGACKKTDNGDVVVDKPVGIQTTQDTLHMPTMGTKTDTVSVPTVGMKTDTIIVKKPVVGTTKKEVKVPVIRKP